MSAANDNRLHLALHVSDLDKSNAFYQELFGTEPDKLKPNYARFNLNDPPVVLTLNSGKKVRRGNRLDHMGIRLQDPNLLDAALARFRAAGHWIKEQRGTVCCHARQDKFWVQDPDGLHWEFYVVTDDMLPDKSAGQSETAPSKSTPSKSAPSETAPENAKELAAAESTPASKPGGNCGC